MARWSSRRVVPFVRHLVAMVCWIALAIRLPAQSAPERLSDSTFWHLVGTLSERGGSFLSDNFVSNELAFQYVIPELLGTVPPGRAYLGVGPDQNFTYIVALQPSIAFIVDIRRQNMLQHLLYKALIELSEDRADFLSRLFSRPRPQGLDTAATAQALLDAYADVGADSVLYQRNLGMVLEHLVKGHGFALDSADSTSLAYVYAHFHVMGPDLTYAVGRMTRGVMMGGGWPTYRMLMTVDDGNGVYRSYLASEGHYRRLRDLQQRNLIVPVVGDFGGPHALRQVGKWLGTHGLTIGAFYVSNVEQYLFQQSDAWEQFYLSVASMPTDSASTFIRSVANRAWVIPQHPLSRSASLLSNMQAQLTAYRDGRILRYLDVVMMSR